MKSNFIEKNLTGPYLIFLKWFLSTKHPLIDKWVVPWEIWWLDWVFLLFFNHQWSTPPLQTFFKSTPNHSKRWERCQLAVAVLPIRPLYYQKPSDVDQRAVSTFSWASSSWVTDKRVVGKIRKKQRETQSVQFDGPCCCHRIWQTLEFVSLRGLHGYTWQAMDGPCD